MSYVNLVAWQTVVVLLLVETVAAIAAISGNHDVTAVVALLGPIMLAMMPALLPWLEKEGL